MVAGIICILLDEILYVFQLFIEIYRMGHRISLFTANNVCKNFFEIIFTDYIKNRFVHNSKYQL